MPLKIFDAEEPANTARVPPSVPRGEKRCAALTAGRASRSVATFARTVTRIRMETSRSRFLGWLIHGIGAALIGLFVGVIVGLIAANKMES
jgi:hypothetical protein